MESFGYMLLYLAKGGCIPWQNCLKNNKIEIEKKRQIISKIKLEITEENLCKELPNEFIHYMKYVKKLDFEQEPDYQYLIGLFISILSKNEMKKNIRFFWIKQKPQKNEKNNFETKENLTRNRNISKSNSIKRLYNKIKESLSKTSMEKNNRNIYCNRTINSEENKNLLDLKFNPKNTNINSIIKTYNNDKVLKKASSPNPIKNITYKKLFHTTDIPKPNKKTNIKLNLIMNEKTLFQNYKFNKRKNNIPIRKTNSTFSHNNITLYNNINYNKIYFINKITKHSKNTSLFFNIKFIIYYYYSLLIID